MILRVSPGYLRRGQNDGWKCLVSDSWRPVKLSRVLLGPMSPELSQNAQRNRTRPGPGLTSAFLSESPQVPKPAHPGGYGRGRVPGRHQEADASLHGTSVHVAQTETLSTSQVMFTHSYRCCSLGRTATTSPSTPTDTCCCTPTSSRR